jgi:molybdopterin converting factor small subunit
VGDRVRILLFSTAREAVGRAGLERPVPPKGAPLDDVLEGLVREFPRLRRILSASRYVVNGEYARDGRAVVRPGDEVAIHPPYSGG